MENENGVEVEQTTIDSPQEESVAELDSSEDTSSDAVSIEKKPGKFDRSNERIRELIRERNAYKTQLEQVNANKPIQLDGITPEGIDPEKYAASVTAMATQRAIAEANKAAAFNREMDQVLATNPILKDSQVAQLQVSALINQGYSPKEAAEIYMADRNQIEEEARSEKKARTEAGDAVKAAATLPQAGKVPKSSAFTNDQIDAMDKAEYAKNKPEIMRQWRAGLIK